MAQDPLIMKLLSRKAELQVVVDNFNKHIQEYQEISATIEQLKRLFPDEFPEDVAGSPAPDLSSSPTTRWMPVLSRPKLKLATTAESILQVEDRLHAIELLQRLRSAGWVGSQDDQKDIRNIASTLGLRKETFHNYGNNTWGLESKFQATQTGLSGLEEAPQ